MKLTQNELEILLQTKVLLLKRLIQKAFLFISFPVLISLRDRPVFTAILSRHCGSDACDAAERTEAYCTVTLRQGKPDERWSIGWVLKVETQQQH